MEHLVKWKERHCSSSTKIENPNTALFEVEENKHGNATPIWSTEFSNANML
jgi:hypothetical protein